MMNITLFVFVLLVSFAAAWSNKTHFLDPHTNEHIQHFNCDVHQGRASAHFNATIKALHRNPWHGSHGTRAALARFQPVKNPIQVQTYFHVITKNASIGKITPTMLSQQLSMMNSAYNPTGIAFNLVNTSYTANDTWAGPSGDGIDDAKSALRMGTYGSLNIYFHTDLAPGTLGTCTLPGPNVYVGQSPDEYYNDGCTINAFTMPNGTVRGYNQGKTAVHEVGHWFGLLHTFEGGSCTGDGDSIADTPQESTATNGCPSSPVKDSCKNLTGLDPIHNFMDYSTDVCYDSFSPLQGQRMVSLWNQYRSGL